MFWERQQHSTWKGLVAGAIGGAVASFAMNQFQAGMSKLFEKPASKEQRSGSEEPATVQAAVAVSETVFDHHLAPAEKEWAGELVHYSYGTAVGALYGAAAEHWEDVRMGEGAVFGAALWALSDEVAVPAFRLSKGPLEYPLRAHAMALASHVVYSVTTELARRFLRSGVVSR